MRRLQHKFPSRPSLLPAPGTLQCARVCVCVCIVCVAYHSHTATQWQSKLLKYGAQRQEQWRNKKESTYQNSSEIWQRPPMFIRSFLPAADPVFNPRDKGLIMGPNLRCIAHIVRHCCRNSTLASSGKLAEIIVWPLARAAPPFNKSEGHN